MSQKEVKISHSGLVARSPEGHAAKGMHIKGHEDVWVEIQAHTFRNWVNENLKSTGMKVHDLSTDLCDGVKLVCLVEVLQNRPLKKVMKPANQHHALENVTTALDAVTADGVKLVNIGNVDIVNGNLKLILGLIWSLIVRYQIGRSKFPPKKLMLAWLKAVLPECDVTNFTTDWNDGILLSALLNYCRPGLFHNWRNIDPSDRLNNCRRAMELAQRTFGIPQVLDPEYLSSPYLDELSGMTYLSYFMKHDSPGYHATLGWAKKQLQHLNINNFTTDWNDGIAVCHLVRSKGGPVNDFNHLSRDPTHWEENLHRGFTGGRRLGVEPILKPRDFADPHVDHLGIMAYVAYYQWLQARKPPGEALTVNCDSKSCRVNQQCPFRITFNSTDVDLNEVRAEVRGPSGNVECRLSLTGTGGTGYFVPLEVGMHELVVLNEDEKVRGCPINIRALPDLSKIMFSGIDPCAIGSIVEVLINSNGAGGGSISVVALSPTGRSKDCPVNENDGVYTATFQPDEAGEWKIEVTYDGEHIQGSPFTCFVFDPNGVKLTGLDGAIPGRQFTFQCDASAAGMGEVTIDIVHSGRSVHHHFEKTAHDGVYRVYFTPPEKGKYKVYIYFNGNEIRSSPVSFRVGQESSPPAKPPPVKHTHHTPPVSDKYKDLISPSKVSLIGHTPTNKHHSYDVTSNKHHSYDVTSNKHHSYDVTPNKHHSYDVTSNHSPSTYDHSSTSKVSYETSSPSSSSKYIQYETSTPSSKYTYESTTSKYSSINDPSTKYSGSHDSSTKYGGNHDSSIKYGGSHDSSITRYDSTPKYGGSHDTSTKYSGSHDSSTTKYGGSSYDSTTKYGYDSSRTLVEDRKVSTLERMKRDSEGHDSYRDSSSPTSRKIYDSHSRQSTTKTYIGVSSGRDETDMHRSSLDPGNKSSLDRRYNKEIQMERDQRRYGSLERMSNHSDRKYSSLDRDRTSSTSSSSPLGEHSVVDSTPNVRVSGSVSKRESFSRLQRLIDSDAASSRRGAADHNSYGFQDTHRAERRVW